ncbi:hypothetical protein HYH03_011958 [Edaphochlamys debaryana]|uniref:Fe2OG dioxygenase domain-containing protein n=1 Tax=Edaphochlamys debaryana TaxID=47281 RepID=A0A836BUF2_9CHLO|nr:hypothetical protein HYH03_011958 [Edaphochlamys debaryana]|eukprot:KAG2489506.1 hypothetical protein HYH03_011958 [Edaphochlamys debaryana]
MSIGDLGDIDLPLPRTDACAMLYVSSAAPFGLGSKTVEDQSVRRGQQLDASLVELDGWEQTLQHITQLAVDALGIQGPDALGVEARLYKLLMYEEGGHFLEHRDTEKEPGMFGTLLVQLPVEGGHTGGELHIKHEGKQAVWQTAPGSDPTALGLNHWDAFELSYAAFYADCEHQLLPVQSGLRVVLAYNLVRTGPRGQAGVVGALPVHTSAMVAAVRAWEATSAAETMGHLLALPLEHKYTEANLSFGGLKGRDHTRVQALLGCGLLEVRLALVTRHVHGGVEGGYQPSGRRRRRRWSDYSDSEDEGCAETAVMGEIYDDDSAFVRWISPDGRDGDGYSEEHRSVLSYGRGNKRVDACLKTLGLTGLLDELDDRMLGGGPLFAADPDQKEYESYTGNSGPTLRYWYHTGVAVFWPRSRTAALPCVFGFGSGLAALQSALGDSDTWRAGALLQALLEMVERPDLAGPASVAELLKLTARAALGPLGCGSAPAVRLLEVLSRRPRAQRLWGLSSTLAEAAAVLADPDFDAAVLRLVSAYATADMDGCLELATCTALPERLKPCVCNSFLAAVLAPSAFASLPPLAVVKLAGLMLGTEQRFQGRVAAFRDALTARQDASAVLQALLTHASTQGRVLADPSFDGTVLSFFASCTAGQLDACLNLLSGSALPERLREGAVGALMGSVLAPHAFAALPLPALLRLVRRVTGPDPSFRAHAPAFAEAVMARPDSAAVLKELLTQAATQALVLAEPAFDTATLHFLSTRAAAEVDLCLGLLVNAAMPERLRDSACRAAMGCLLAPACFAALPLPALHKLLAMVAGHEQRFQAYAKPFADAVVGRPESAAVMRALLAHARDTVLAEPALDGAVLHFFSTRDAFHVQVCLDLLTSSALPERLREGACRAVMNTQLAPETFARLQLPVVLRLARMIAGPELPLASYAGAFAAAVLARPDRNHALRALLTDPATQSTVLEEPAFDAAVLQFVSASAASDLELCLQLASSAALPDRLRERTCAALMGSLLAPDAFRLRPLPFVHRLAGLAFGPDPRFGAHAGAFTDAVLARPDTQEVLRTLLRDTAAVIRAVMERHPQAVRLAQGRRRQLEAETEGGEPALRWDMPGARLPAYPQVEAFLRGPQQSFRFNPNVNSIVQARACAADITRCHHGSGYSYSAEAEGRGKETCVIVRKNAGVNAPQLAAYQASVKELEALCGLLGARMRSPPPRHPQAEPAAAAEPQRRVLAPTQPPASHAGEGAPPTVATAARAQGSVPLAGAKRPAPAGPLGVLQEAAALYPQLGPEQQRLLRHQMLLAQAELQLGFGAGAGAGAGAGLAAASFNVGAQQALGGAGAGLGLGAGAGLGPAAAVGFSSGEGAGLMGAAAAQLYAAQYPLQALGQQLPSQLTQLLWAHQQQQQRTGMMGAWGQGNSAGMGPGVGHTGLQGMPR